MPNHRGEWTLSKCAPRARCSTFVIHSSFYQCSEAGITIPPLEEMRQLRLMLLVAKPGPPPLASSLTRPDFVGDDSEPRS